MKKQLFIFLLMLLPLAGQASPQVVDNIYYNLNSADKTAEVAANRNNPFTGDVVIPSSIIFEGVEYSVTKIGSKAFSERSNLTSITLPNSLKTIGSGAFRKCSNLSSINIPNSVTTIEQGAFYHCSNLTSVYIGTGLETIGENIFNECDNLKTAKINSNALVSKNYESGDIKVTDLFFGTFIKELVLGENVTSIGNWAFFRSTITSLKMTDNVKTIGDYAFMECSELTSVELPNSLTDIGEWAFEGCYKLSSVTIPQSVKCVHLFAFQMCHNLTKVVVNSNEVVARDNEQFYTLTSCFGKQVKEFVFGEDVRNIAYLACSESEKLSTVTIPSHLACIDDSAFHKCTSIADMYCYAEQVPEMGKDVFVDSNYKNATLHVPANAVEAYRNADQWKDFGNIVALTDEDPKPTAISSIEYAPVATNKAVYDLQGHQLAQPKKGLNIIKMSDGTTKKVIIK